MAFTAKGHVIRTANRNATCVLCKRRWLGPGGFNRDEMGGTCPVTDDMRTAIHQWAAEHGRGWKAKLVLARAAGENVGPELQQVRNVMGPSRLLTLPANLDKLPH